MKFTLSVRSFQVPAHALHLRLTAQLAFGAHLARDPSHFGGEGVQLVHHGVDGVLQLQDLAAHVHGDLLRQIAVGDRGGHVGDVSDLAGQIGGHEVHVVGQVLPGPVTPRTCAWPPSLPSVPTSRATRVTSEAKAFS
jgi:hypothetical protein